MSTTPAPLSDNSSRKCRCLRAEALMLASRYTYRVKTPSGGMHVYVRVSEQHHNRIDSIPDYPGIDIRSDGGYVVGPGSTVDGKVYEAVPGPIEPAGQAVEAALLKKAPKHNIAASKEPAVELDLPEHIALATDYLKMRAPEAQEGAGGNETTYSVAAKCREFGLSQDATLELMLEHWNEAKAFPAWLPNELSTVVANAYKYATGSWGGNTAVGEFEAVDIGDIGAPPAPEQITNPASRKRILKVLDYAAMQDLPDPVWLVEGILMKQSAALMFGKSNAFKSFLGIDLGLHVALGRSWHGHEVKQAKVLFVATEGAVGVAKQRIPGWYAHYKVPVEQRSNAYLYPQEIALDDKEQVEAVIATAKHLGIGLLVLDIFGGTMNGTEVEDTTARAWVRSVQRLIREAGLTTLTVAHTGWQDETRARMHTHFWGSFDSRLRVEGDKEKLTTVLSIERHKDADSRGEFGFKLEQSEKTLVPVMDESIAKKGHSGLPTKLQLMLNALEEATKQAGQIMTGERFPGCAVTAVDLWRDIAVGMGISGSSKDEARRKAFRRAFDDLRSRKLIDTWADYAWSTFDEQMMG
ncbi:MAG: hypothetical protein DI604_28160 [Delftia acidovorans]|nr:MAG: hypothetical protein DI604_28160 [Delftia acidovorans]